MLKKFFLFFIFLFSINFVLACSTTGPCQGGGYWCICDYPESVGFNGTNVVLTENFTNVSICKNDIKDLYMNYYFLGYERIEVNINLFGENPDLISLDINGTAVVSCTDNHMYCLFKAYSGTVPYIFLRIESLGLDDIDQLIIDATNLTSLQWVEDIFYVNSFSYVCENATSLDYVPTDNFIGSMSNGFNSYFPLYSTISVKLRFTYVLMTILLFLIILYVGVYMVSGNKPIPNLVNYIAFIFVILIIFYFVSIQYIPIGIVIIFILILLLLAFFKFRSN